MLIDEFKSFILNILTNIYLFLQLKIKCIYIYFQTGKLNGERVGFMSVYVLNASVGSDY